MAVANTDEDIIMTSSNNPVMNAVVVEKKSGGDKRFFTDIGKVWTTKNPDVLSVKLIPGISVNEFSLFVAKEQDLEINKDEVLSVFVVDGEYWHRVGSAFSFKASDVKGFNVRMNGNINISGNFVIQRKKDK
ncbi:hypothetical protein [Vibrio parahaemolyticus]|uniref:hypothetical protein n=1 Tax=Vibrio parahaemolyticus TaxID=670 RepID=UPI0004A33C46|nr:hypothetical protein [Vibrio parahaemolyticus]